MKKLLLVLVFLFVPSFAWAQCNGSFPPNTVCGNYGSSNAPPTAQTARSVLPQATTFFVSTTGSDVTGTGTQANPWATCLHALFVVTTIYDFGSTQPTIQFADGTYNMNNSSACFLGTTPVGGNLNGGILIKGNIASPANVIFDGGGINAGINLVTVATPGAQVAVEGITFQNARAAFSPGNGAIINIVGPITLGPGLNVSMDVEAYGVLYCNEGTPVTTITVSGANSQLLYLNSDAQAAFNSCTIAFGPAASETFAVFNIDAFGYLFLNTTNTSNFTGTVSGVQFFMRSGGNITYMAASGYQSIAAMPGTPGTAINYGGYFNGNNTPFMPFASLPPGGTNSTNKGLGYVVNITDGKASNCGDGSCTTFGTSISAGTGTLPLLAWWNGSFWSLIGK